MRLSITVHYNPRRLIDQDQDILDIEESGRRFDVLLREALEAKFPGALIDIGQRVLNAFFIHDLDGHGSDDAGTISYLRDGESAVNAIIDRVLLDRTKWICARDAKTAREKRILEAAERYRKACSEPDSTAYREREALLEEILTDR